jgi:hypothetical protein
MLTPKRGLAVVIKSATPILAAVWVHYHDAETRQLA